MSAPAKLLEELKALVIAEDNDAAEQKLAQLKEILLDLDSLPPLCVETPSAAEERKFAMEVFEYAVILSINQMDRDSFNRYMSCLKPYYLNYARGQKSEITNAILGLNLLYLLVENRLADFHCELELLSEEEKQLPTVTFCTQLDKHLVVGSYDQVLVSAANPPTKYFSFFLTSLLETVRINIGECTAAAYTSLTLAAATKILMFDNHEETVEFIAAFYPTWEVDTARSVVLLSGAKTTKSEEIPSLRLISQNLSYATELERIV